MNLTGIEWVKNPDGSQGYTWNPITGCNNQIDGMCKGGNFPCYAYRLANGRLRNRYLANKETATQNYDEDSYPFYPRFWEDRVGDPIWLPSSHRPPKPKGIFSCDMSDLFGIGIPEEWTRRVLNMIQATPYNRYYLLTKQPQNLIKFSPFPDNCWVGVTATESDLFANAVNNLMNIRAKVKYVSIEPLLSWQRLDISTWLRQIDWVIIGAQTKPYKPPKIEWVEEIVKVADRAGVKVFLKENLMPLFQPLMRVPNLDWWGNVFGLRQEVPV